MAELASLYLAGLIGSAVHECGHVLACLVRGRSILAVDVGSGVGVHLGRLTVGLIPWGGGVTFENRHESLRNRVLLYGSGPLASTACAGIAAFGVSAGWWSGAALLLIVLQLTISLLPVPGSDLTNIRRTENP